MKTISLWQPWATLIVIGAKRIETRDWSTGYRGPLAIHAAKQFAQDERETCTMEPFRSALIAGGICKLRDLPLGAVIGTVTLVDCIKIPEGTPCEGKLLGEGKLVRGVKLPPDGDECDFGNFTAGRYAWVMTEPFRFPLPMPYRGERGLFDLDTKVLARNLEPQRPS